MKKSILLINFLCLSVWLVAQGLWVDSLNQIANAKKIQTANKKPFKVLHLGDSHIQADLMTHTTRNLLVNQFGNGGTGLVFPYKGIKTNGQQGYKIVPSGIFLANKLVRCKTACNVGLMGYNAYLHQGDFFDVLPTKDTLPQFVTVLFNQDTSTGQMPFQIETPTGVMAMQLFVTDTGMFAITELPVTGKFRLKALQPFTFNAIALHTINDGIWYGVTGANSATLAHYVNSDVFFKQLKLVNPDLIVVSIGTNESYGSFMPDSFEVTLNAFTNKLKYWGVDAQLVFTTPANNCKPKYTTIKKKVKGKWRKRKVKTYYHNQHAQLVAQCLVNYCNKNDLMYWNWYAIMGGDASMKQWVEAGLAAPDHIHFKKSGYELQGKLFYEALIKSVFVE